MVLGVALCAKGGGGEAVRLERHALRRPRDGIAPSEATRTDGGAAGLQPYQKVPPENPPTLGTVNRRAGATGRRT